MAEIEAELSSLGLTSLSTDWDHAVGAGFVGPWYVEATLSLPRVQGWGGDRRDLHIVITIPNHQDMEMTVREPTKLLELGVKMGLVRDIRVGNAILDTRFVIQTNLVGLPKSILVGRGIEGLLHPQEVSIDIAPLPEPKLASVEIDFQAFQAKRLGDVWNAVRVIANKLDDFIDSTERVQYLTAALETVDEDHEAPLLEALREVAPEEPDEEPDTSAEDLEHAVLHADNETAAESYRLLARVDPDAARRLKERAKALLRSNLSEKADRDVRAGLAHLAASALLAQ